MTVKLPAPPRGVSVAKPSETAPKPPDFALRAAPRSPLAIPSRASARGTLAKASENLNSNDYIIHRCLIKGWNRGGCDRWNPLLLLREE